MLPSLFFFIVGSLNCCFNHLNSDAAHYSVLVSFPSVTLLDIPAEGDCSPGTVPDGHSDSPGLLIGGATRLTRSQWERLEEEDGVVEEERSENSDGDDKDEEEEEVVEILEGGKEKNDDHDKEEEEEKLGGRKSDNDEDKISEEDFLSRDKEEEEEEHEEEEEEEHEEEEEEDASYVPPPHVKTRRARAMAAQWWLQRRKKQRCTAGKENWKNFKVSEDDFPNRGKLEEGEQEEEDEEDNPREDPKEKENETKVAADAAPSLQQVLDAVTGPRPSPLATFPVFRDANSISIIKAGGPPPGSFDNIRQRNSQSDSSFVRGVFRTTVEWDEHSVVRTEEGKFEVVEDKTKVGEGNAVPLRVMISSLSDSSDGRLLRKRWEVVDGPGEGGQGGAVDFGLGNKN